MSGGDTRLQLRVEGKRAVLLQRIGSNPDKTPIWCKVLIDYPRPLPPGTVIKWCWLKRLRIGVRERWEAQFTLEGTFPAVKVCADKDRRVGVDVGWRLVPKGLRVAYWVDSDGQNGEVILPHEILQRWPKSDSLQSIQDNNFNAMKAELQAWLAECQLEFPEALQTEMKFIGQWRSPRRLARLMSIWKRNRLEPHDNAIFERLSAWLKQDIHLYDWRCFNVVKAIRKRKEIYECFADKLRENYGTVYVEDIDWRKLMETPTVEDDSPEKDAMREHQRHAACGELLEIIKRKCRVVERPAPQTTMRCHKCGELSGEPEPGKLIHTCGHCGEKWDQDCNAAWNLLRGDPASAKVVVGVA